MKKTKTTGSKIISSDDLLLMAFSGMSVELIRMKITLQNMTELFEEDNVRGTVRGVDVYEVLQGIHDSLAAALSYMLNEEEEAQVRKEIEAKEEGFVVSVAGREVCGHA